MSKHRGEVEQAALTWLTRVNDPAFEGWDDLEAWLAGDPLNAEVYWRMAEDEADIAELLVAAPVPVRAPAPRLAEVTPLRRPAPTRRWQPFAAAAAAVLVLGASVFAWMERPQPWSVVTAPGEQRSITLADGTEVHLDGGTRVNLDRARPRYAELDQGRLLVQVVHDERRPFSVIAGDAVLTDLGTAFDVTRLSDGVRVAVSEGVVRVDVDRQSETLRAGEGLVAVGGAIVRRPVSPEAVGAWRGGRLTYENERLAVVAEDLSRALGRPMTIDPAIAGRRFTGSLTTEGSPDALRARLALLLGVTIVDEGAGWRLQARPPA